jgi:pilus assembly protein Flp/PilA
MSRNREKGQGLLEYALILVLVAIVVVVALGLFGDALIEIFSEVNSAFP